VGIAANFTSFFNSALLAVGLPDGLKLLQENRIFLETLMDLIVEHQERVLRSVCSRFAPNLAFIVISDDLATATGLPLAPDLFRELFEPRMQRLMTPAKEYGQPVVLHTGGKVDELLPILVELGFAAIHPVDPESNDIFELKAQWEHRLTLMGGFPIDLLISGSQKTIKTKVQNYCTQFTPGGRYVFGTAKTLTADVPPENFIAMTRAIHTFGRSGSGQEK
jgi:uroporphyrinogen decarboxylase